MSSKRRKKARHSALPAKLGENEPTPERIRQASGVQDEYNIGLGRKTKRLGSILDYMLGRGQIDGFQHAAGKQAWELWNVAEFSALGAVDASAVRVDGEAAGDGLQRRLDAARHFGAAMQAIGHTASHAYCSMVLHEIPPAEYGRTHCGTTIEKRAIDRAYDRLGGALRNLDMHFTGGKRPNNKKMRSGMAEGGKPAIRPLERQRP